MSAHNALVENFYGDALKDPGNAGVINCHRSPAICQLISAGAETRTLARPTRVGAILTLHHKTDGGDITVTVTGGINETGDTTFTFSDPGQFAMFISCYDGTDYFWRLVSHYGIGNVSPTESGALDGLLATVTELNRAADASTRVVPVTASSLVLTEALHDGKLLVLDRAAGIALTLPAATGSGGKYRMIIKTTFTGAATVKSASGADVMIGHALMGNNSDNTVVDWPAIAASTYDTVDMLGTGNSTGGMAGQEMEFIDIATNMWFVTIRGDAAGTEATPFADTVA